MLPISSKREKQLWFFIIATIAAIFSTLFFGQPLLEFIQRTRLDIGVFLGGMLSVAIIIILHGLKRKSNINTLILWLGISTVYLMLFLRLGLPERSHLIEYSILAIFIYEVLLERTANGLIVWRPTLLAIISTILIGIIDELLQIFIPDRVFDLEDIVFNSSAIIMAIVTSRFLNWVRNRKN